MHNQFRIKALFVLATSFAPLMSFAVTEKQAVDACAKLLADRIEIAQGAPLRYSIGEESTTSTRKVRETMLFEMYAIDPGSNETIVRADCIVSWSGRVRRLSTVPLLARNAD